MRPQNLTLVIQQALTTGPIKDLIPRIRNELMDYFAHEVMQFSKDLKREDQLLMIKFFEYIFKRGV